MLARPKITTTSAARNYFEMDTYYLNNEFEQGSFYGKLKDEFGLGEFNLKDFDALLSARYPKTGKQLLKLKTKDVDQNGDRIKAACDLTFAADKSVSILYEILDEKGKEQIRQAFSRSVAKALDFTEANYATIKSRNDRNGKIGNGKMIFVRFDHSESRNNDMHLHQHALAINMTQDHQGNWRSMEYHDIMINHQLIGQIQRNAFATELQTLGYEIEITDPRHGTFALKNVDKELRQAFSTRSNDIKNEMKASEQISYKATHIAQKQTAQWKDKNKDRAAIQVENIEKLKAYGADIEVIKTTNHAQNIQTLNAQQVVDIAIIDLTDKQSVFGQEDVLKYALKLSLGAKGEVQEIQSGTAPKGLSIKEIQAAFRKYEALITIDAAKNQYTTQEIMKKEREIFSQQANKIFTVTQSKVTIEAAIKTFEKEKGFSLTDGQNKLVHTVLSSDKQFIIAQGVAGAGKSISLEIVRNLCHNQNRQIVAIAPTGTATDNLSKEANITESFTAAKFLQENGNGIKDAILIVDEAGMLGLRDTYALMEIAIKNNCKVIFSGDTNQKKSISQGDIFQGMQRAGFETIKLDEGNRQKTALLKKTIRQVLDKDLISALNTLENTTREIRNLHTRRDAVLEEYLKDRHNSLLITSTNADRQELNDAIRKHLVEQGEVTSSKEFDTRDIPTILELEKRSSLFYNEGQKVYLSKNIGVISAGREATVTAVNTTINSITLEFVTPTGKTITEEVNLSSRGTDLNQFTETRKAFGIGDQIITKKNDAKFGLKNGWIGTIADINGDTLTVQFEKEKKEVSLSKYRYIQHAYAITDFASQGKTTDKVIVVVDSRTASFNDFYTQITRAKYEAHIFTDNLEELRYRAEQDSIKLNATEIYQNKGIKDENKYSTGQCKAALYQSSDRKVGRSQEARSRNNMRILSSIPLAFNTQLTTLLLSANELTKLVEGAIQRAVHTMRRAGTSNLTIDDAGKKLTAVQRLIQNAKKQEQHQSMEQTWNL